MAAKEYRTQVIRLEDRTPIFVEVEVEEVGGGAPGGVDGLDDEGFPTGSEQTSKVSEHMGDALRAVEGAHTEAEDAVNGIGLVKVMGRASGFIAAHVALASNDADFVLVPEVPFDLEGPTGFLAELQRRVASQGHALVIAAEGAGQRYVEQDGTDAGGNRKLGDIGTFLRKRILAHFDEQRTEISMKYIDPSYTIRSQPACASDSIYCARLGANAVHAALSGRTACLVGRVNNRLVHVPMNAASSHRNQVDPEGPLWRDELNDTGQPARMLAR